MIPDSWRLGEVAVVGLGRSGSAAAKWLLGHGIQVYASDAASTPAIQAAAHELEKAGASSGVGGHDLDRISQAAAVIVSPGVPPDVPAVAAARNRGVEIVAELDLAVRALGDVPLIAVTGTNGKSTVTALIAHLLCAADRNAVAAGNIGRPLIDVAGDESTPEWLVVEASSFQLHDAPHLAPAIGVLTNLGADHLDRYPDIDAYHADKRLLFRNAKENSIWILNADDAAVHASSEGVPGKRRWWSLVEERDAWYRRGSGRLILDGEAFLDRSEFQLLGDHNVANALAAALAATVAGVDAECIGRGLRSFTALPHRLEPVADRDGIRWINDSKATNVSSTAMALGAMDRPYVLILGGRHKGDAYASLGPLLDACRLVVAYGEAAPLIAADLRGVAVEVVPAFDDAVRHAAAQAGYGEVVLLSPACASFDQFADFEERGDRFRRFAEGL